jgi:hypothetical protein
MSATSTPEIHPLLMPGAPMVRPLPFFAFFMFWAPTLRFFITKTRAACSMNLRLRFNCYRFFLYNIASQVHASYSLGETELPVLRVLPGNAGFGTAQNTQNFIVVKRLVPSGPRA